MKQPPPLYLDIENVVDREFYHALNVSPVGDTAACFFIGDKAIVISKETFENIASLAASPPAHANPGLSFVKQLPTIVAEDLTVDFLDVSGLPAGFPNPLVLEFVIPLMQAKAVLAVALPQVLHNLRGQRAFVPAGVFSYHEGEPTAPLNERQTAVSEALSLAQAAHFVGLPPSGSALVLGCPASTRNKALQAIFRVFAQLGFGPFVAIGGIKEAEADTLLQAIAPLSRLSSQAFGTFLPIAALEDKARHLYVSDRESIYAGKPELIRFCAIALALDAGLHFAASGRTSLPERRLHLLGDYASHLQRWQAKYRLPIESLLPALLHAGFVQHAELSSGQGLQRALAQHFSTRKTAIPDAVGLYALGLPPSGVRCEHDSIGEVCVPAHVHYGAQTERSRQNFAVEGIPLGSNRTFVSAMGLVKRVAAETNVHIGLMPAETGKAVALAAREVEYGLWDHAFPVDRLQGGGGIGMNMNVNEVVANRASELLGGTPVHPNDDVNLCHSTNDLVHTAMHLAFWDWLAEYDARLGELESSLQDIVDTHASTVKLARTCLMDALPITLGQQFSGYVAFVSRRRKLLHELRERCLELPMGAGGVGTGLGIAPNFLPVFLARISAEKGAAFRSSPNFFDALQHADFYVDLSAHLRAYATGLSSLARDLRLMNSGPRAGWGELVLPAVQPGSSIMPGKINPLIPEEINQIAYLVCGNDTAVGMAAEGGDIDLNVWEAVFLYCLTHSFQLLCNGTEMLINRCLTGLRINTGRCAKNAESSLALATVISELYGYEKGVEIAALAAQNGSTIREAALLNGLMTEEDADRLLDPALLTDRAAYILLMDAFRKRRGRTH